MLLFSSEVKRHSYRINYPSAYRHKGLAVL